MEKQTSDVFEKIYLIKERFLQRMLFKCAFTVTVVAACLLINNNVIYAEQLPAEKISEGALYTGDAYRMYNMSTSGSEPVEWTFNADFRKIDEFCYYDFANCVYSCACGMPTSYNDFFQILKVGYKATYQFDEQNYGTSSTHKTDYYYVGDRGWGVENTVFQSLCPKDSCLVCHQPIYRRVFTGVLLLVDRRGSAEMTSNYNANAGDTVMISPTYNEYVKNVEWGIKYSEGGTFTTLSDGTLPNGTVVSGSKSRTLVLSNLPQDDVTMYFGAYVYDKDNQLPANTTYPNTKFVSRVTVKGKPDDGSSGGAGGSGGSGESGGSGGSGESGGGTGESGESGGGTGGGNGEPGGGTGGLSESGGGSGESGGSGGNSGGSNPGGGNSGGSSNSGGGTSSGGSSGGSGSGNSGGGGTGGNSGGNSHLIGSSTDGQLSLDDYRKGTKNDEYVTGTIIRSSSTSKQTGKNTGSKGTGNSSGTGSSTKNGDTSKVGNPKLISEADKNKLFEQIRNNSREYTTNSETSKRNLKENASGNGGGSVKMSSLDADGAELYSDADSEDYGDFSPDIKKKSIGFYIFVIGLILLFMLILLFVLFFGVIVVASKENDMLKLGDEFNVKVPVGLRIVTVSNKDWALNFGELLSKHEVVDVYLGILFAYVFEGEDLKIMTQFAGEKKKEIATEKIRRQLSIGSKRGMQ